MNIGTSPFIYLLPEILENNIPKLATAVPITNHRFFNFKEYVFDVSTQAKQFCAKYSAEDCYFAAAQTLNLI